MRARTETDFGLVMFDLDGTLRTANPAAESLTGYDADDLRSATFWSLVSPDDRERMRGLFSRAAEGEPGGGETAPIVIPNFARIPAQSKLHTLGEGLALGAAIGATIVWVAGAAALHSEEIPVRPTICTVPLALALSGLLSPLGVSANTSLPTVEHGT